MAKKKYYKIRDFCGIDARQGGASKNSLSYIKNMLPKEGVLMKRHGWRVLHHFRDNQKNPLKINGIFEYEGSLIVHAGTHLYKTDMNFEGKTEINAETGALKDERSCGFVHSGLLFLCGGASILVYDGVSLKPIYNHERSYIPTTKINVPDSDTFSPGVEHESPNLLTEKRINSMQGRYIESGDHVFKLDAPAKQGSPFTLTAQFMVKRSHEGVDPFTSGYVAVDQSGKEYRGVIQAVMHTDSLSGNTITAPYVVGIRGEALSLLDDVKPSCTVKGDTVTLHFNCPTPAEAFDNIVVSFCADTEDREILNRLSFFCPSTTESGRSVLLVSCGDNRVIYTHFSGNLFYFPAKNVLSIGRSAEKISAILPMADNYVCLYKENSLYRVLMSEGRPTVYSSEDTRGCISPFTAVMHNGDCLTLGGRDVYGISGISSDEGIVTRLSLRSAQISPLLERYGREELLKSCMVAYDGFVYLFIKDTAYIMQKGDRGYSWYTASPCPCYCPAVAFDRLYMGRENGDVAIFDEEYTDREITYLSTSKGDFLLQNEGGRTYAAFNGELEEELTDTISFPDHYTLVADCQYRKETGDILISAGVFYDRNMCVAFYEGMEIALCDENNEILFEGEITDTSPSQCSISCGFTGDADRAVRLFVRHGYRHEYQMETDGRKRYLMYDRRPAFLLISSISDAHLTKSSMVDAAIRTQPLDFGSTDEKHLYAIEIVPCRDTEGRISIGCETRKNRFKREIVTDSHHSLDRLDFGVFGFNPTFKRAIRIPCLERSFDYAVITASGNSESPFGIEEINLIYSHGRE